MAEDTGPIIIMEEEQLNEMKGEIKCAVMRGVKYYLMNVNHFCLRDPASMDWRNNKMLGIKLIQTTNEMLPLFQIFESELQNIFSLISF